MWRLEERMMKECVALTKNFFAAEEDEGDADFDDGRYSPGDIDRSRDYLQVDLTFSLSHSLGFISC